MNTNNGEIFVKPQNGFELDELHDVLITNPQSGEVIQRDGSLWKNKFTWEHLLNNWSTEPTLNTIIVNGEVYNYNLNGITRYRFVPTIYNPTQDAFYGVFDGINLTNLITTRG